MNVSRRWFLGGAASLGTLTGFGLSSAGVAHGKPRLKFGVISDPHLAADVGGIMPSNDTRYLEKAFRRFRDLGANAVVISGDIADRGLTEELEAFQRAWERAFPAGCGVERIVVSGNHDWDGHKYGTNVARIYPDEAERARHVLRTDMAGNWERILHEKYEPVFKKEVNGYTFIGQHWEDPYYRRLPAFMAAHGAEIDPKKPFFYVQHAHPKDTCFGPWADWDEGPTTKCLSKYPNAVAFSGHSHLSMLDERAIWQGAFTSVGAASLRYGCLAKAEFAKSGGIEGPSHYFTNRTALFVTVYDDAIVYSRHDFEHDLPIGEDWVQPLPAAETDAFAFAPRAMRAPVPHFPNDARIAAERTAQGLALTIPAAVPDVKARAYVFEVDVAGADGKRLFKRVVANGFNCSERDPAAVAVTKLALPAAELPTGALSVSVFPVNCFGKRGKALVGSIQ